MRPPIPHAITSFVAATLLSVSVPVSAAENTRFERGSEVYNQQCAACHQAQGQGIPGSFPPQKNHTAQMYNATDGIGGRRYLGHVLQYGLTAPSKSTAQATTATCRPGAVRSLASKWRMS